MRWCFLSCGIWRVRSGNLGESPSLPLPVCSLQLLKAWCFELYFLNTFRYPRFSKVSHLWAPEFMGEVLFLEREWVMLVKQPSPGETLFYILRYKFHLTLE